MDKAVAGVRAFSRFYTQLVGALDTSFLGSGLTLGEARLLFEIGNAEAPTASDLQAALDLDAGYLSRMLRRFEAQGWITRGRGVRDARRRPIALTPAGRETFAAIDWRQRAEVVAMIERLQPSQRSQLLSALGTARALLDPGRKPGFTLRSFRTGDMGMIAARQSILYEEANGWGRGMEVIECEVTAAFLRNFRPGREQCWVAEVDGAMAGSVFVTDEGDGLSRLRLLYVEPFARGMGIGAALVGTCIGFAREAGYRAMTLWTHDVLESARRLYAGYGFRIVETAVHEAFGKPEQGETWRLELAG